MDLSTSHLRQDGELPRRLNAVELTLLGIGACIGAGIFVLTGAEARIAGPSVPRRHRGALGAVVEASRKAQLQWEDGSIAVNCLLLALEVLGNLVSCASPGSKCFHGFGDLELHVARATHQDPAAGNHHNSPTCLIIWIVPPIYDEEIRL